jgi:23S rRNA (uracil1939-C5)-methyltransferase
MEREGSDIELRIERLGDRGDAVARNDGLVYFVKHGVPGDVVQARVVRRRKKHAEAEIVEILTPSRNRTEPRCKFFGTCGGCSYQHVSYELQLQEKQRRVLDAFERIGGFHDLDVKPILGTEDIYFYRNKMEFSFSRERWLTKEEIASGERIFREFGLGLHIPGRFDKVLNIDECWLQSERSSEILNTVREFCRAKQLSAYSTKTHDGYLRHLVIRQSTHTNQLMVNLVTTTDEPDILSELAHLLIARFPETTTIVNNITDRKSMVAVGDRERVYHGPGYITEKLGEYEFRVSANSFFQTNTRQAERLYETAKSMGELKPTDVVFDLYCGTGTIALYISDSVGKVIGIDHVESAIDDARLNASVNGVENCAFLLGDLKEKLTRDTSWIERPDVVILDPPRSGLHPKVVAEVAELEPGRIVYVSCNPATQARDAKMFSELGYRLGALQPVDMFPHTSHVENVVAFRR